MKYFKSGDLLIYTLIIFLLFLPLYKNKIFNYTETSTDTILININQQITRVDANKNDIYEFLVNDQKVLVEVKDKKVRLLENSTYYQIGVNTGWIDKNSPENIICLPLKIIISFEKKSNNPNTLDGITY